MFWFWDTTYILVILGAVICSIASWNVSRTYKKFSKFSNGKNLMAQDVAAGNCRNNLYVYREAFDICLNQFLPEVIPADVAEHAFYPRNVQLAVENGVSGRFDEAMLMAAQRRFGRDYEFPSKNDLEAMKQAGDSRFRKNDSVKGVADILASHWRVA